MEQSDTKPTLLDLYRRHPEVHCTEMIEGPGIPYIKVLYVFFGWEMAQEAVDAVLHTFNRLAKTNYTSDDIQGVSTYDPRAADKSDGSTAAEYPDGKASTRALSDEL
ncbi:MAG: hypothetical protein JO202_00520 [Ktedonobacteraceae bacterium]|nr:hypothetical protein [Ktedonobacteraceae bacterium]